MRILIVNRHIDHIAGGSETQCHEVASALSSRGHDVTYAVCLPGSAQGEYPYAIHALRGAFHSAFRRALDEIRPDVIYWRFNKRKLLGSVLAARRRGVRFVFAVSHINDVRAFAVKPFYGQHLGIPRRIMRSAGRWRDSLASALNYGGLHLCDAVVFQHAGQIPRRFRGRHTVIYNSAAPPAADELTVRASAKRESGNPAAPYVAWVGSLKKSKNPEEFLRLARDLEQTGVEFRMAGKIQDPAYRRMLESDALPRNFRYLGLLDAGAANAMIARCLFLVHTCEPEGFPNVFIQAWARRKAVVSLYFDPGSLLATHGIGFCSQDYETFKEDVARLIADVQLREATADRALRFAAEHCDRGRNVARLEALFVELADSRGR